VLKAFAKPGPLLVLLSGGLVLSLAVGTRQGFGVFLVPISTDLGWNREIFGLAIAIQNIVWGVTQPAVGIAADRWGPRPVIAVSAVVYALGLWLMSATSTAAVFYLSAGALVGLALSGTGFVIIMGAVGRVFPEDKRSLALGVVGAMGSLGQFAMLPFERWLIDAYGWSGALSIMAVLILTCAVLAIGMGRAPPAANATGDDRGVTAVLRHAGGHGGYLLLNAGFFVCGFQITFILGHLPAYFTDQGLTPKVAALAVGLIGLANIPGSVLWGALGGRFRKKYLLSLLYLARSVLMVALIVLPPSQLLACVFAATMGVLWLGTIPLTSALVADIFGRRYMTSLFGVVFFSHQVGAFLGVWFGGLAYDLFGSYDPVWWLSAALGLAATVLHAPIDDRPVYREAIA